MSRTRRITLSLIVIAALVTYGWYALWGIDHVVSRSVISPDGKYIAHFMLLGDGEEPPYGQALTISPAWNPLGHLTGQYLFKGHCQTETLVWESARQLLLTCKPVGTVVRLVSQYADIEFRRVLRDQ